MLLDEILRKLDALPPDVLIELEKKRLEEGNAWLPNPGAQTDAYLSPADILLYGGAGGGGKALALDTPLVTPFGWTSMGEVQVGDALFDENGMQCRVVGATPVMFGRPCYHVVFSDGSSVVADANHGWLTLSAQERAAVLRADPDWRARRKANRQSRAKDVSQKPWVSKRIAEINRQREHHYKAAPKGTVRTTEALAETLRHGREINHSIAVAKALACDPAPLLIDPYLLGVWLGDGTTARAEITTADDAIVQSVAGLGYHVKRRGTYSYGVNGGLLVQLRQIGVIGNKHIPPAYLRASVEQRLALLQGLMDTDGTADHRGQCEFTSTKRRLIDDVLELVLSLGIKATVREGIAKLNGRVIGPKYTIKFLTEKPAFRLARKLIRQKRGGFRGTHDRRYVIAVEKVASVPVRCIEVDSPSHLYLAGRQMVPTHNSDLGLGLAFTQHRRSLILRRRYANLSGLTERAIKINGSKTGFNGSPPPLLRTADDRYIQFGANQHLGDEQDWQGIAFDFKYFDEATQFLEQQIRFHLGWMRLSDEVLDKNQRVRAVLGSNPPVDADGDWLIGMFRPWLDLTHPKPAKPGELRWFVTADDGTDLEVAAQDLNRTASGASVHKAMTNRDGKPLGAKSRSFIPAKLADNPFLVNTDYGSQLDALPEPLRSAIRDGNFMAARKDADWQVIPTQWIIEAQARWKPDGFKAFAMTAMGFDPAGGGRDCAELVFRHGPWYGRPITAQGAETADGSASAATIIKHRRDSAAVIVDVGGGYGGSVTMRLNDNSIGHIPFNGAATGVGRTKDRQLGFTNKRAEAWWRFREALDPDQEGGSPIALPPDPEVRSDLAAPTYKVGPNGIVIEPKEKLRERLGRSPGKGDAIVMAWADGQIAVTRGLKGQDTFADRPKFAHVGYANAKRKRRR